MAYTARGEDFTMRNSVDDLCGRTRNVKLTVKKLRGDRSYVLIEGDRKAFKFLSDLFRAHARGKDCAFHIAPHSAGNAFFNKKSSELGLYLHRLPCSNKGKPKL
jgi:hypothetical protein